MNTSNTTTRNIKHVSEYEGSPCLKCIVKMTCTKTMMIDRPTVCQDYIDFILTNIQAIRENKKNEKGANHVNEIEK